MSPSVPVVGWFQLVLFTVAILACAKPLGLYMARVFEGRSTGIGIEKMLGPVERLIYQLAGVRSGEGG